MLLVVGTIEACSMIFLKQSLAVAAYEGARTAIIPGATKAQVEAACNQILADRKVDGGTVTDQADEHRRAESGRFCRRDGHRAVQRELRRAATSFIEAGRCRRRPR